MPGLLGLAGDRADLHERVRGALWTIDMLGSSPPRATAGEGILLAASALRPEQTANAVHEDERFLCALTGDIVGHEAPPWSEIAGHLARDSERWLDLLDGHFAAAIFDKAARRLRLYADHYGCRSLFWTRTGDGLAFSTSMPTFVRLLPSLRLDEEWLHRFLYFGYWPGEPTFLSGVRRLAAGTRLTWNARTAELEIAPYESRPTPARTPLSGRAALARALDVFHRRVPLYFGQGRDVEVALSGGLDTRTILAFVPDDLRFRTFTYGAPGSPDQREADGVVRRMRYEHRRMEFDAGHESLLPGLIHEVVWLSGGQAWINRAMLPAVYRFVRDGRVRAPYMMSGIGLDTLYRGHNNARGDLNRFLGTGQIRFDDPTYDIALGARAQGFRQTVMAAGEALQVEHGRLSRPESYLSYLTYTLVPSYFAADLELGANWAILRVPGWDREIVNLAYELEYSTIYNSKYIPHDHLHEFVLQAHLMRSHERLARVPLHGMPLSVFREDRRLAYALVRLLRHGPRYLRRRYLPHIADKPLEDWDRWYATILGGELRAILGDKALVWEHADRDGREKLFAARAWNPLARLASVELLLQLMASGWTLESLPYSGVRDALAAREHAADA